MPRPLLDLEGLERWKRLTEASKLLEKADPEESQAA